MAFFTQFFTWWNGQTLGTRFFTWRKGERVGTDDAGNTYYQAQGGKRRWVIYNGYAEASSIPPGWHGWMHHTVDAPPTGMDYVPRGWQKPHESNHTGSARAYRPPGSLVGGGKPAPIAPDYEPWKPH
jgi:NADH:ubiquinone oxidoreductase subunit